MGRGRTRTRWSEAEAARELEAWRSSGETLPRYCQRQGILYERLRRWRIKLEGRAEQTLRAVRVVDDGARPREGAALWIELASGHRLEVSSGTDLGLLAGVVAVLEGA